MFQRSETNRVGKIGEEGLLLTVAANLTPSEVEGRHKQRREHNWNGSKKKIAKLSKSGRGDNVEQIGARDLPTSKKLPREVKRGRCEVEMLFTEMEN
ncbi:hypothetical protein F2Q70_00013524 [Brassica cretica]|uniref:Uncharacterized protein n=1 Tax=Brassica cretica TaxID=69181 RepID=A0A8S9LU23_BRACR|nr:hypothetical protein F2Q70_00013524 [Brassica cretica]